MDTHTLETAEADLVYDVAGPLPTADGRPPLLMIGQPMTADGFRVLTSHMTDRTVVTYDPRGLGRSTRKDGRTEHTPTAAGRGRARRHRGPRRGPGRPVRLQRRRGHGAGAGRRPSRRRGRRSSRTSRRSSRCCPTPRPPSAPATACATSTRPAGSARAWPRSWRWRRGRASTPTRTSRSPCPTRAACPRTTARAATRCCPTCRGRSAATEPDVEALLAASTRIVIAVGEESGDTFTARTAMATAALLGPDGDRLPQPPRRFPRRRVRLPRAARGVRGQAHARCSAAANELRHGQTSRRTSPGPVRGRLRRSAPGSGSIVPARP